MKTLISLIIALAAILSFALGLAPIADAQDAAACEPRVLSGTDFSNTNWTLAIGDAAIVPSGEAPISFVDVNLTNSGQFSTLQANVQSRRILAHGIAYLEQIDANAMNYVYTATLEFRLTHTPTQARPGPETVEGGLWTYDGQQHNYGVAWQWLVNPWMGPDFGLIRVWDGANWISSGTIIQPDDGWHSLRLVMDPTLQLVSITIDGNTVLSRFAITPKPTFGQQITSQLAFETISLNPGGGAGFIGEVQVRNWEYRTESPGCVQVAATTQTPEAVLGTPIPEATVSLVSLTGVIQPTVGANVRSSPGECAEVIGSIATNRTLQIVARAENWLRILLADGVSGWVREDLLTVQGDVATLPHESIEPISCPITGANQPTDCSIVQLDPVPDPAPRSYAVTWSPACVMVLQFYQNGQLVAEDRAASSGSFILSDPRLASGTQTEIKIWVPGASVPQSSYFTTIN